MDRLKRFTTLMLLVLLAAACDDTSAETTSEPTIPQTTVPATTPEASAAVPPSSMTSTALGIHLGTQAAFDELVATPLESTLIRRGIAATGVPLPDLLTEDPVNAFKELVRFDLWTYTNANIEGWADVLAVEDSEAWSTYVARYRVAAGLVAEFDSEDGFQLLEARLATDDERSRIPPEVLDQAGEGSVAIVSIASMAPHSLVEPGDPENFPLERSGYMNRVEIWLISPTRVGWRFYWSETL